MTAPAVLALVAHLAVSAGDGGVQRGWYVRFADDAWEYSPVADDVAPERTRPATFLHLGDDGTALQVTVGVREDSASYAGRPLTSEADGFAVWSGTWRRTPSGEIEVQLGFRLSSNVVFSDPPVSLTIAATLHGRHLITPEGPLVPLGYVYPGDAAPLRRQLYDLGCAVPGRDPACRTVRR